MGLVKDYLRYEQDQILNSITGPKGNISFFKNGRYCSTTSGENIRIWDLKTSNNIKTHFGDNIPATILKINPLNLNIAVGYQDGSIKLFKDADQESQIEFHGHKTAITSLNFDNLGHRLVSGSQDTNLVIWDLTSETGMFRLRGHKGNITQCAFLSLPNKSFIHNTLSQINSEEEDILVSSSKDGTIKFWDIKSQHCFKTLLEHTSEVWDLILFTQNESKFASYSADDLILSSKSLRLLSISSDNGLRLWDILFHNGLKSSDESNDNFEDSNIYNKIDVKYIGHVMRNTKLNGTYLNIDQHFQYFGCHGNDNVLSIYHVTDTGALNKRFRKRSSKLHEGSRPAREIADEIKLVSEIIVDGAKIKSFDMIRTKAKRKILKKISADEEDLLQVIIRRSDNAISLYQLNVGASGVGDCKLVRSIEQAGHRTDVRSLCFGSDNDLLLSTSAESVKLWNRVDKNCIRTMPCEYGICSLLLTSDKFAAVGTKTGKIHLYDCGSGDLLENIDAHEGTVWALCHHPNNTCVISGGADKWVKFWDLDLVDDPAYSATSKRLTLCNSRSLELNDDILCLKASADHKFLAVGLLDNTVKLFFLDTLKFFLCLYGHSMPVTCLDISQDSTLLATGSADRSVKIWGTRFGDCHKTLLGHTDTITALVFVPPEPLSIFREQGEDSGKPSHFFFTSAKDGLIIQWDADKFERILTLKGHHSEVWALATSPSGNYLASSSHDRTIRIWVRTDEILSLKDERDREMEEEGEKQALQTLPTNVNVNQNAESGLAAVKSVETLDSVERIIEALDVYVKEKTAQNQRENGQTPQQNASAAQQPQSADALDDEAIEGVNASSDEGFIEEETPSDRILTVREILAQRVSSMGIASMLGPGIKPYTYVLNVLKTIKFSELEYATLLLPRAYLMHLFAVLHECILSPDPPCNGWEVEVCCKLLCYLLRTQITACGLGQIGRSAMPEEIRPIVMSLKGKLVDLITEYRDCIGFNRAALSYLSTLKNNDTAAKVFPEIPANFAKGLDGLNKKKKNGKKRKGLQYNNERIVPNKEASSAKSVANRAKVFVTPL